MRTMLLTMISGAILTACGTQEAVPRLSGGGIHGSTLAARSGDANSVQCPYGGNLLSYGVDKNGNGVLDADEVAGTFPVCNGAPGTALAGGNISGGSMIVADSDGVIVPLIPQYGLNYGVNAGGWLMDANGYIWHYGANEDDGTLDTNYTIAPLQILESSVFESSDCSGPAYAPGASLLESAESRIVVTNVNGAQQGYYLPDPNAFVLLQVSSYTNSPSGSCHVNMITSTDPNDPNNVTSSPGDSPTVGIRFDKLIPAAPPSMPGTPPYHIDFLR